MQLQVNDDDYDEQEVDKFVVLAEIRVDELDDLYVADYEYVDVSLVEICIR